MVPAGTLITIYSVPLNPTNTIEKNVEVVGLKWCTLGGRGLAIIREYLRSSELASSMPDAQEQFQKYCSWDS